jgi:MoaA/NifB/PqqE/SkfB family radical SAM enzyme
VSNASLAGKDRLRELKESGLDAICFSLDSLDDSDNETVRGDKGRVRRVLDAASTAAREGLIVSIAPVFFPGKVEKGLEVIKYCQEHGLGASGTQVAAVGGWEGGDMLSPDEHDMIRKMVREYPRFTLDWVLSYSLKMCCPAGKEKVAVTTFGDVVGCSINPIAFGNIYNESLYAIWRRMGKFSQYKKDSPICLSAEDTDFVQNYLKPLSNRSEYPVYYRDHPFITSDNEKDLFKEEEVASSVPAE